MSSPTKRLRPIRVFYSYAHDSRIDKDLKRKLEKHLGNLRQQGQIKGWGADNISPGTDREQETLTNLENANIILLLISPDYMDSDSHNAEMRRAIARRKAGKAYILPILLRPTERYEAEFSDYEDYLYPSNHKAVTSWSKRDEAFNDIAQGIRKIVQEFREIEKTGIVRQTGSRTGPNNGLRTPITTQASPGITTRYDTGSKKTREAQRELQIAEQPSIPSAWKKKPIPKSRSVLREDMTENTLRIVWEDLAMFVGKCFSSKELAKCSSRKGNARLFLFLFVLIDVVGLSMLLGGWQGSFQPSWFITPLIFTGLFIWGLFNIFTPFAIVLSLVFGGAWGMIGHNQGWPLGGIFIILAVVSTLNFFLFKKHERQGIFTIP